MITLLIFSYVLSGNALPGSVTKVVFLRNKKKRIFKYAFFFKVELFLIFKGFIPKRIV